jgi:phage terminase large subunit GpA-like protein
LDAVLETAWPTVSGGHELKIAQMAIDSGGHYTHEVYEYCRLRQREGVIPIKGSSIRGKQPIGKGTPVDINKKNAQIKRGVLLYTVGHDTIKATLYGRLRHEKPGPGYIHFGSASTDEFLRQLTPWKVQIKYVKGQAVRDWVKPANARDEMGDCTVYAYAALQLLGRRFNKGTMWDQLEQQLSVTAPKPSPIERKRTGWLDNNKAERGFWLNH